MTGRIDVDVVVVGAGIAGLSAAKTLVEAGRDVVVLEARDRDNSPPSGEPGVLLTFLAGENAEAAARMNPNARRAAVLDGFVGYVGLQARDATEFHELDWSAEKWTRGAYAATFRVGGLTRFGADLRRSIGPIHWACTDIAGVGHMHMRIPEPRRSLKRAASQPLVP